jgi:hypothetical protein
MKAAEGSSSSRVLVTVSPDVRQWLEKTARFNGGTMSGERMAREAAKDRGKVLAASE